MELPDDLLTLLRAPSPCFVATVNADGSPQLTQTWVDTDGTHVLVNTVEGYLKTRNVERDPRVSMNVCDAADVTRYVGMRGRVVGATTDGAREHIDALAQKYLGRPYPWWGGRDQVRVLLTIEVDHVFRQGG